MINVWLFQVYNPTGFNKIEKVVKYNQTDVKLTVWDTSGEDNDVYSSFLSASNTCWELFHCGREKLLTLEIQQMVIIFNPRVLSATFEMFDEFVDWSLLK